MLMDMVRAGWAFRPASQPPAPVRCRFQVTGGPTGTTDIAVAPAEGVRASISFTCDSETYVLLMLGRLTIDSALTGGRLAADGDDDSVAAFSRWFGGT